MNNLLGGDTSLWRERIVVVAIVLALHFAVLTPWMLRPAITPAPELDMEVSLAPSTAAQPETQPAAAPPAVPQRIETPPPPPAPDAEQPAAQDAPVAEPTPPAPVVPPAPPAPTAAPAPTTTPTPTIAPAPAANTADSERAETDPDYRAAFLNNKVTYPLVARRMGLEGVAIINVEVLATGQSGQVKLQRSSGHFILDESALRSAQTWSFIPAKRGAQPITKWMTIAVRFSLKDNQP